MSDPDHQDGTRQLDLMAHGQGFVAALDQSGGSTPRMLESYGIPADAYSSETAMFDQVHAMRARIMLSPCFNSARVMGTILFQDTLGRDIGPKESAEYLWQDKGIVPILKIDRGLEPEEDDVHLMRPIPGLADILEQARKLSVFGTKARSFIRADNPLGISTVVAQQFEISRQVLNSGLVPILEPEVDIYSRSKAAAESRLLGELLTGLDSLGEGQRVVLKLSLPEEDDFYRGLVQHPRVIRVLALSGGLKRADACCRLARNRGVVASFSRALLEGLGVNQTPEEFDTALDRSIQEIFAASLT